MGLYMDIIKKLMYTSRRIKKVQSQGGRFITEILCPPSSLITNPGYHSGLKYSSRNRMSPNSIELSHFKTEFLWPPLAPLAGPGYNLDHGGIMSFYTGV